MSNKKWSTAIDDEKKKAIHLCNALVNDSKSIFYTTDKTTKARIKKARNSLYKKDNVFVNIYNGLEDKTFLSKKIPLNTPFLEKTKKIIRAMLYSFNGPFQALQADIASISFLGRSAVDPKFCLLFVDIFTSNIYTYPIKKKESFSKKNGIILQRYKEKKAGQNEVANESRV